MNINIENKKETQHGSEGGVNKKKEGLEFMAIRFNVVERRRKLRFFKQVTPGEYFLLEEIELATIGGQNGKSTIRSSGEFYIKDFATILGIGFNKVYVQLKSLEAKNLIIRQKTRSKGLEIIGLNPAEFGQILIDSQHALETKKHLKMVVNNSPNIVNIPEDNVPNENEFSPESGPINSQIETDLGPNQDQTQLQITDIKEEKPLLDSFRPFKTVLEAPPELSPIGSNMILSKAQIQARARMREQRV